MTVPRTPMTRTGFERLRDELDRLKRIDRPAIIKAIAEARAHGDLSENAEYHAAREKQSFIEGRINELEGKVGGRSEERRVGKECSSGWSRCPQTRERYRRRARPSVE